MTVFRHLVVGGARTTTAFLVVVLTATFAALSGPSPGGASTVSIVAGSAPSQPLHIPARISELPVPPTVPSDGNCTAPTGCVSGAWGALGSPGFFWNAHDVLLGVTYAGAPPSGPTSIFSGTQVLLVKVDGTKFSNGTPWKCLTCGVPASNEPGIITSYFTYPPPRALPGDRRVLVGNGIMQCGANGVTYDVSDPRCTPANTSIYPIYWGNQIIGGPPNKAITNGREWRLSPDGVHLGWNELIQSNGDYNEYAFVGRLSFDPSASRYNLTKVTMLYNSSPKYQPYDVEPGNKLKFNPAGMVGEFRGWTSDGRSTLGFQSYESASIDAWATSLATGKSQLLTSHAEYTDPMFMSPNGKWLIDEQVLGSGRLGFISGMQGIPPITDQLSTAGYVAGIRNNGMRRFFLPYLVNTATGQSEQINAGGDPNWNAAADPVWLADNRAVVWAENQVVSPACGGTNPLPCPASSEPGGRRSRVMIARFPSLPVTAAVPPAPASDKVPWGTPFTVGQTPLPPRAHLPAGRFTLAGATSGSARVAITVNGTNTRVMSISATYKNFRDNQGYTINGIESVTRSADPNLKCSDADSFFSCVTFQENITLTGRHSGTKITSANGLVLSSSVFLNNFLASGTMKTTVDGVTYSQPGNGD